MTRLSLGSKTLVWSQRWLINYYLVASEAEIIAEALHVAQARKLTYPTPTETPMEYLLTLRERQTLAGLKVQCQVRKRSLHRQELGILPG